MQKRKRLYSKVLSENIESKCKYTKTLESEQREKEPIMGMLCMAWIAREYSAEAHGWCMQQHSTPYTMHMALVSRCYLMKGYVPKSSADGVNMG
jgi:hypothetical protein